jgi:quinol monooxygenase YgiN
MAKVLFTISYELNPEKREEYFKAIKELKLLVKTEGIESYNVYEVKGKPNHFQEIYLFTSEEVYDNYDDNTDERVNLLISKISDMTVNHSARYTTLVEIPDLE